MMKNDKRIKWIADREVYIIAFLAPLIILILNGLIKQAWPVFPQKSSILGGDLNAGYVPMMYEVVHKVKSGDSLFFSWNAAGGYDSLVCFICSVISPFTLLMFLVKESAISECAQWVMALRWMLTSVTMVYFFQHTRHNTLKQHRKWVALFLGLAFTLGNGMIYFFLNTYWNDVMILFPLLLLQVEKLAENKKWFSYYILLTLCMFSNFYILYHICVFLVFWFFYQLCDEKEERIRKFLIFAGSSILAAGSSFICMLPFLSAAMERAGRSDVQTKTDFLKGMLTTLSGVFSKFFLATSMELSFSMNPNVFLSVAAIIIALFFVFVPVPKAKKVLLIGMTAFMFLSFFEGHLNLVWHGFSVPHGAYNRFVNMFVFTLTFMALQVFIHIKELRLRHIGVIASIVFFVYLMVCVFEIDNLKMYSFMITFILFVFYIGMLCLIRLGKLSYGKGVLVICMVGILELLGNGTYVMRNCLNATFMDYGYNREVAELKKDIQLSPGERFAGSIYMFDTGMTLDMPSVNGFINFGNGNAVEFSKRIGQMNGEGVTNGISGASPIVNLLYNIRYCSSTDVTPFSDVEEVAMEGECKLYRTRHIAGLGYMVDRDIEDWRIDSTNCFAVQNEFMEKATGAGGMFDVLTQPIQMIASDETLLEGEEDPQYKGFYSYDLRKAEYVEENVALLYMQAEEDYDLYGVFDCSKGVGIGALVNGELVRQKTDNSPQKTIHLENIKKGDEIIFAIKAGKLDHVTMRCGFANFHNDKFLEAYEQLADEVYEVKEISSAYINGNIEVKEDGIMMTSVPAMKGWTVVVDGSEASTVTLGDTFIGVPLTKGNHTIEFRYETPGILKGGIVSVVSILAALFLWIIGRKKCTDFSQSRNSSNSPR